MPRTLQTTRHFQVTQVLRERIRFLPPGSEVPTIQKLMIELGTSQTTIDRALLQLRREGLVSRPAGKQRLVVNPLGDPATRRIAIIRPDYPSRVFDEVALSIVSQMRSKDAKFDFSYYRTLATLDLARAMDDADEAVLIPTSEPYPPHMRTAMERPRKPLVITQEIPPGLDVHGVHLDNTAVSRKAVDYLVSLGHRRILFFNNEPQTYSVKSRFEGWRDAMLGAGLQPGDDLICDCHTPYGQDSLESAYREFTRWLTQQRKLDFTAIFVSTTTVSAMAVIRVLRERGLRVPQDVSVLGYSGEDRLAAYTNPALTALELDMASYGGAVSQLLDELFRDPDVPRRVVELVPNLVIRESTAARPRSAR